MLRVSEQFVIYLTTVKSAVAMDSCVFILNVSSHHLHHEIMWS